MYVMENRTTIQVTEELRKKLKILASERDHSYEKLLEDMVDVFKELDRKKTLISLPNPLAQQLREKASASRFKSVSEYVTFIMRVLLVSSEEVDQEAIQKVKQKLAKLGYL